jgi:hypothetical protein
MKLLSETLTELGIAFSFPIRIKDDNGKLTYFESSNGCWQRWERDAKGKVTYYEDSNGCWCRCERDANGEVTYFENSGGLKRGTPKIKAL